MLICLADMSHKKSRNEVWMNPPIFKVSRYGKQRGQVFFYEPKASDECTIKNQTAGTE